MTKKSSSSSSSCKGKQKKNSSSSSSSSSLIPIIRKSKRSIKPSKVFAIDEDSDHMDCSEIEMQEAIDVDSFDDDNDDDLYSEDKGINSDEDEGVYHFVENGSHDFDENRSDRQQEYTVLSEDDIRQRQEDVITSVSTVLSISKVSASVLLCHYNWSDSNVNDAWFADEEKVRTTVGLLEKPVVSYPDSKKVTCGVCFDSYRRSKMFAAACGHPFCSTCWKGYITTSINDGPGCLTLRCPDPSCEAAVDQDMINKLVSDEDMEKYSRFLLRSYVEANRMTKWCPAPGCDYAVDFVVGSGSYDISCNCAYTFCWNCLEDAHRPVDCDTVSKWILKNTAESENVNWILANSKPCPKCKRPIEKNNGCMHMTCTPPCKFQFCWLCLGSWSDHGKKTGGFYACNRYQAAKKEGAYDEDEKRREMAKNALERYTHYYERWATNQTSRQKAIGDLQKTEAVHIEKLSNEQCQLKSQLKFITDAWQQIIECRRVLKWTYAYGYYLPEDEVAKRAFFEYLQGQAESALERLHKCAEKDLKEYLNAEGQSEDFNGFRTKLTGLTSVTRNFFENLVRALENGLVDVESGGTCSKATGSKVKEGPKKGKGGKGKGKISKSTGSTGAGPGQEDQSWSCQHCTYFNGESAIACQMCHLQQDAWSCQACTYYNGVSATVCQMCNEGR